MEVAVGGEKHSSPFKFNSQWMENEGFVNLVKSLWVPFNGDSKESAPLQIESNLKRIKQETVKWAYEKRLKMKRILQR
jgi:hypothetical protein